VPRQGQSGRRPCRGTGVARRARPLWPHHGGRRRKLRRLRTAPQTGGGSGVGGARGPYEAPGDGCVAGARHRSGRPGRNAADPRRAGRAPAHPDPDDVRPRRVRLRGDARRRERVPPEGLCRAGSCCTPFASSPGRRAPLAGDHPPADRTVCAAAAAGRRDPTAADRAHAARARGAAARRARTLERRDRRAALPRRGDGQDARRTRPLEARAAAPRPGRRAGRTSRESCIPAGSGRRVVSQRPPQGGASGVSARSAPPRGPRGRRGRATPMARAASARRASRPR
jgi:hypothetical protein